MSERRSLNEIAFDILERSPQVEALVEEWFASLPTNQLLVEREDLRGRLGRIRAAVISDADLALNPRLQPVRDFLLRESSDLNSPSEPEKGT